MFYAAKHKTNSSTNAPNAPVKPTSPAVAAKLLARRSLATALRYCNVWQHVRLPTTLPIVCITESPEVMARPGFILALSAAACLDLLCVSLCNVRCSIAPCLSFLLVTVAPDALVSCCFNNFGPHCSVRPSVYLSNVFPTVFYVRTTLNAQQLRLFLLPQCLFFTQITQSIVPEFSCTLFLNCFDRLS